MTDRDTGQVDANKLMWLPSVAMTLEGAAVRLVDTRSGYRIFVRAYQSGQKHMVVVNPDGVVDSQKPFFRRLDYPVPDWVTPTTSDEN